jgi:hypothetical protein
MAFGSLSGVGSLMTAYVVTCHKMQGGEKPLVMPILHTTQKSMLNREWAYTAVTRASQRCIMFYTELGLKVALNKQEIKGTSLSQKVAFFRQLASAKAGHYRLPKPEPIENPIEVPSHVGTQVAVFRDSAGIAVQKTPGLDLAAALGVKPKSKPAPEPAPAVNVTHIHVTIVESAKPAPAPAPALVVDGGDLAPVKPDLTRFKEVPNREIQFGALLPPAPARLLTDQRFIDYTDAFFPQEPAPYVESPKALPTPAPTVVKVPFKFGVKA